MWKLCVCVCVCVCLSVLGFIACVVYPQNFSLPACHFITAIIVSTIDVTVRMHARHTQHSANKLQMLRHDVHSAIRLYARHECMAVN